MRIIAKTKYSAHTDPIFKDLKVLKIMDLFKLNILKFYYKYIHNELPTFFKTFEIRQRSSFHNYNTRNKCSIQTFKTNLKLAEKCLRFAVPVIFNGTEEKVLDKIETHSLEGYLSYAKQIFISRY